MEDLTVYIDDSTMVGMAEQLEPTAGFVGSKTGVGIWVGIVGVVGGAWGAVTLSPDIRNSLLGFMGYLLGAVLLVRGTRPVTNRLLDASVAWLALGALFWTFCLGFFTAIGGRIESRLIGYGLSVGMGMLFGLLHGSLNPNFVRREDLWQVASLLLGPTATGAATYFLRHAAQRSGAEDMAIAGAIAGGIFMVPMGILLIVLWNRSHGFRQMAVLFLHNDNFAPKAVAYLDRALDLSPDNPELYNLRGIAYSKMDDVESARRDWNKVIELRPRDADPYLNIGSDSLRHNAIDEAISAFESAINLDPGNPTAHSNLGTAFERRDDLGKAIESYSRAIALDRQYSKAYSNRGYAYFRNGDYSLAIQDCDRAIELDPRLPMAHVNRGHALAASGAKREALASYRAALNLDPDPAVREEVARALEGLGYRSDEHSEDE